jgi:hypothetical protein
MYQGTRGNSASAGTFWRQAVTLLRLKRDDKISYIGYVKLPDFYIKLQPEALKEITLL